MMFHGHSWVLEATVEGDLDPKVGMVRGAETLQQHVTEWCGELNNRNLDDMLPGVVTSPLGIATAALNDLALRHPRIATVRVLCTDGTRGEVSRTSRQT